MTHTLTMHGNELRKAGRIGAALGRLRRAVDRATEAGARATACAMLARTAGEAGDADLFDATMDDYRRQLDRAPDAGMFANEFTFREIRLRGLVAIERAPEAARLMDQPIARATPTAPQWTVIEKITVGSVLLGVHDLPGAQESLLSGLREAELAHLPHQAQRAIRIAIAGRLETAVEAGRAAVSRLARIHSKA